MAELPGGSGSALTAGPRHYLYLISLFPEMLSETDYVVCLFLCVCFISLLLPVGDFCTVDFSVNKANRKLNGKLKTLRVVTLLHGSPCLFPHV